LGNRPFYLDNMVQMYFYRFPKSNFIVNNPYQIIFCCFDPVPGGEIAVERQDGRVSDHAVYFVAGIVIFGLLAYLASRSAVVLHKVDLPTLRMQAKTFSLLPGDDHAIELLRIANISRIVDTEVARRGSYERIRAAALRKAITDASGKTRNTMRILVCVLLGSLGSLVTIRTARAHGRLHDSRENVRLSERAGVEGFIRIVGRYIDPGMAARLKESPTSENLADAFRVARDRVNIPCSTVARLFPKGTPERMALLEYGKVHVRFAVDATTGGSWEDSQG